MAEQSVTVSLCAWDCIVFSNSDLATHPVTYRHSAMHVGPSEQNGSVSWGKGLIACEDWVRGSSSYDFELHRRCLTLGGVEWILVCCQTECFWKLSLYNDPTTHIWSGHRETDLFIEAKPGDHLKRHHKSRKFQRASCVVSL